MSSQEFCESDQVNLCGMIMVKANFDHESVNSFTTNGTKKPRRERG